VLERLENPTGNFSFGCPEHLAMFPTAYFSIFRPTSLDALKLMMLREGTGKGLNIKGKSAKEGVLSGFVPFLQISENEHVHEVKAPYPQTRCRLYFKSEKLRDDALGVFEDVVATDGAPGAAPADDDKGEKTKARGRAGSPTSRKATKRGKGKEEPEAPSYKYLERIDSFATQRGPLWGIDLSLALLWELYAVVPDISHLPGWETGRKSEPEFMNVTREMSRREPTAQRAARRTRSPQHARLRLAWRVRAACRLRSATHAVRAACCADESEGLLDAVDAQDSPRTVRRRQPDEPAYVPLSPPRSIAERLSMPCSAWPMALLFCVACTRWRAYHCMHAVPQLSDLCF
jgi:hypothetical protein